MFYDNDYVLDLVRIKSESLDIIKKKLLFNLFALAITIFNI